MNKARRVRSAGLCNIADIYEAARRAHEERSCALVELARRASFIV